MQARDSHDNVESWESLLMFMFRVAVSRSKDVPPFGPNIPAGAKFGKQKAFADFLLTKGKKSLFHDFVYLFEDCLLRVIRDGAMVRAFASPQFDLRSSFLRNFVLFLSNQAPILESLFSGN